MVVRLEERCDSSLYHRCAAASHRYSSVLPHVPWRRAASARESRSQSPVGTMSDLMVKIIYPASDAIFYITTRTPSTDAEWIEVQGKALMVAESANLLMMPAHMRDEDRWLADAKLMQRCGRGRVQGGQSERCQGPGRPERRAVSVLCHVPSTLPAKLRATIDEKISRTRLAALLLVLTSSHVTTFGAGPGIPSAAKPEEVGLSSERLPRIHETVQRYLDSGQLAGAVTLVARRGRIAHFEAHGVMDLDSKTPMRKDAIFRIASMSKPVTGVAIMMLMEEGKLRLTDPVSRFIPEFKELKVAVDQAGLRRTPGAGRRAATDSRLLHGSRKPRDHGSRSADPHLRTRERKSRQPAGCAHRAARREPDAGRPDPEAPAGPARLPARIRSGPTACWPAWTRCPGLSRSLRDSPTTHS